MLINFQRSILQSRCASLGCKFSFEEQVCNNDSSSGLKASWVIKLSRSGRGLLLPSCSETGYQGAVSVLREGHSVTGKVTTGSDCGKGKD